MKKKFLLSLLFVIVFLWLYSPGYCETEKLSDCNISRESCNFFEKYYGVYRYNLLFDAPVFTHIDNTVYRVDSLYNNNIQLLVNIDELDKVDYVIFIITDAGIKKTGAYPDFFSAMEIGLRYLGMGDCMYTESTDENGVITLRYENGRYLEIADVDEFYMVAAGKYK